MVRRTFSLLTQKFPTFPNKVSPNFVDKFPFPLIFIFRKIVQKSEPKVKLLQKRCTNDVQRGYITRKVNKR